MPATGRATATARLALLARLLTSPHGYTARPAARWVRLAFLMARFSSSVLAGLRFVSLFWFIPLLMCVSPSELESRIVCDRGILGVACGRGRVSSLRRLDRRSTPPLFLVYLPDGQARLRRDHLHEHMTRGSWKAQRVQPLPDSDAFLGFPRRRNLCGQLAGSRGGSFFRRVLNPQPVLLGAAGNGVHPILGSRVHRHVCSPNGGYEPRANAP